MSALINLYSVYWFTKNYKEDNDRQKKSSCTMHDLSLLALSWALLCRAGTPGALLAEKLNAAIQRRLGVLTVKRCSLSPGNHRKTRGRNPMVLDEIPLDREGPARREFPVHLAVFAI